MSTVSGEIIKGPLVPSLSRDEFAPSTLPVISRLFEGSTHICHEGTTRRHHKNIASTGTAARVESN